MSVVPRQLFVPMENRDAAYENRALSIGEGQTISQPLIVATMAEAAHLNHSSTVLEIGTGSGYGASVLSRIAKEVYTIERLPELANKAKETIKSIGYDNIHVRIGDGTLGWPEHAPYDAIVVTAAGVKVPQAFYDQLKIGGRIVMPVGQNEQYLKVIRKLSKDKFAEEKGMPVQFVPLI